jgi:hypothetical protein
LEFLFYLFLPYALPPTPRNDLILFLSIILNDRRSFNLPSFCFQKFLIAALVCKIPLLQLVSPKNRRKSELLKKQCLSTVCRF